MRLLMLEKEENKSFDKDKINYNGNQNDKNNDNKEENVNKIKSPLELKKEEKYFKLVNNCLLGYKDKIRVMKRAYENDTIKLFIEILINGEKELIHLKNVTFYSHDELIDTLKGKFNKLVKTHYPPR